MRVLYIESVAGASGDMLLAALSGCGLDWEAFKAPLEAGIPGLSIHREEAMKGCLACWRVWMTAPEEQPHRHLPDVEAIIAGLDLPGPVKAAASTAFSKLAEAEARAHGVDVEDIHFHEVGALDSIMDVVGFHWALHLLRLHRVEASPLKLGWGTVDTDHGALPVPVPAVAVLTEGLPTEPGAFAAELTTPTGALLVGQTCEAWGPMPPMKVLACGVGGGHRDQPVPNILRAWVGEVEEDCRAELPPTQPCTVFETNLDDSTPEQLSHLRGRLEEAGALDVTILSGVGKKGRIACWISVVCHDETSHAILDALFRHSTALGVRVRRQERICLPRKSVTVQVHDRPVRVKLAWWKDELVHAEPEYEDCARVCSDTESSLATVQHLARQAALES